MSGEKCGCCGGQVSDGRKHERTDILMEATGQLDYLKSTIFPTHYSLKDEIQRNIEVCYVIRCVICELLFSLFDNDGGNLLLSLLTSYVML